MFLLLLCMQYSFSLRFFYPKFPYFYSVLFFSRPCKLFRRAMFCEAKNPFATVDMYVDTQGTLC